MTGRTNRSSLDRSQTAQPQITLTGTIQISAPLVAAGALIWGIRPEHLDLVLAEETDGAMGGRATTVERTGHVTLIISEVKGLVVTALFAGRPNLSNGAEIHLKPRADKQHLFDAASGARIG